jgi:branched-chain amino acid transport system ATP-binding protein
VPDGDRPAPAEAADRLAGVPAEPGVAKPDPILVADSVRRRFEGVAAVDVDHLEVQRGVVTALIGPNGAGKTTLFNLLTGFDRADMGTWTFEGRKLEGTPAYKVATLGMVRTFQLTRSLAVMSVLDNMKLGAQDQQGESFWRSLVRPLWRSQEQDVEARADELLERFRLGHMRAHFAGELSGGQRKLLEMARALMAAPRMVMLDEPMAGVNPALRQSLLGDIRELRGSGMTVMFVEHDMDVVHDISDWVVVMAEGQIIAEGRPSEVGSNPEVIDAYLGAHHDAPMSREEEERQLQEAAAVTGDEEAP